MLRRIETPASFIAVKTNGGSQVSACPANKYIPMNSASRSFGMILQTKYRSTGKVSSWYIRPIKGYCTMKRFIKDIPMVYFHPAVVLEW